jgi:4-amino-4-deoxy-L-arabinose transferase-like glycosyltransferase
MTIRLRRTSPVGPARPARELLRRLVLGRRSDPVWARPGLWAVLVLAAVLYCWDLGRNGNANTFYAAAVLSGTESWKAFFYGALDSASFITVDKPPFAFWVMGLSARIFGFNSWSLLLPQAAEGVAAVAIVYAAVRRSVGGLTGERGAHAAGLIAALVLTLTPVVVAIDRDDNPDTMLTLLLTLGAWALLESLRAAHPGQDQQMASKAHPLLWLLVSAVAFGLAFNTKMLEGFIPLPALAVVYLIAASGRLRARVGRLLAAGGMLAMVTLSWMTIVDLIPKSSRPYVSGSTNDTVWNLAVDYNGFGRITGNERGGFGGTGGRTGGFGFGGAGARTGGFGAGGTAAGPGSGFGSGPGAGAGPGAGTGGFGPGPGGNLAELAHRGPGGAGGFSAFGGQAGIGRMFGATLGGQISWLLPFAAIALIGTLVLIGRRPRTDLARASILIWGGWLVCEFLVLSFQQGIQHSYYTSAMAPPIAALTGIGAVALYQAHHRSRRSRGWRLVLPLAIALTGVWSFVLLRRTPNWNPWLSWTVLAATVAGTLVLAFVWLRARSPGAGPGAPVQGPAAGLTGGQDPPAPAGRGRRLLVLAGVAGLIAVLAGPAAYAATPLSHVIQGTNPVAGPSAGSAFGGAAAAAGIGRDFGAGGARPEFGGGRGAGYRRDAGSRPGGAFSGAGGTASTRLIAYLEAHRDGATWLVAVRGSDAAAAIILQTGGLPVMAMGGFSGTDPAPTLAQLQQYVQEGKLRYVLTGGAGGFGGGGGTASSVTAWVEQACTVVPASAYGGSTASGGAGTASGASAAGGAQTLYRCG